MNQNKFSGQYSSIEDLLKYSDQLEIPQHLPLMFKIKTVKQRLEQQMTLYLVELQNQTQFFKAYFTGTAGELLYLQEHDETKQVIDIRQSVICLKQWQFKRTKKNNNLIALVEEFSFLGEDNDDYYVEEFQIKDYIKPQQNPQKMKIKKNNINKAQEEETRKLVKQENSHNISSIFQSYRKLTEQEQKNNSKDLLITELFQGQRQWQLIGRVIQKSPILQFKSRFDTSQVDYFTIHIMDKNQNIINGGFYRNSCHKFYNLIDFGKIYSFMNAKITAENSKKRIFFEEASIIEESNQLLPKYKTINQQHKISELIAMPDEDINLKGSIDILVYVYKVYPRSQDKLSIEVTDMSENITINLWKDRFQEIQIQEGDVVGFLSLRPKRFNNKINLNSMDDTIIIQEYEEQEVDKLKKWAKNKNFNINNDQPEEKEIEDLSDIEKQASITKIKNPYTQPIKKYVIATIISPSLNNVCYPSCPSNKCLRKVNWFHQKQTYRCEKCNVETDNPKFRYRLSLEIVDSSSNINVTVFDESATKLVKMTANEFHNLSEFEQHETLKNMIGREHLMTIMLSFKDDQGMTKEVFTLRDFEDINYSKQVSSNLAKLQEALDICDLLDI